MAANIPWSKIIPVCTTALAEVTKDLSDNETPGKVTFAEAIASFTSICAVAGVAFDNENAHIALNVCAMAIAAIKDKRVTIAEVIAIADMVCAAKGIEFDKTGFTIPA